MNANYLNIPREEYDDLKRKELVLEILFKQAYKGLNTPNSEMESAFSIVYAKEIEEIKTAQDERYKKLKERFSDIPTMPNEVIEND